MKINMVYHNAVHLGSGYMGSTGLKNALEANNLLDYSYSQNGEEFLDIDRLQSSPIFFVRGFLHGRMPIVARAGNQFKAAWQSESYFTRHGVEDVSTEMCVKNQKHFNMYFVCSETDLEAYTIPTYFLPSWADMTVLRETQKPTLDGLGMFGGIEGREDFLNQDKKGIIHRKQTKLFTDPVKTADALADMISSFHMLVAPPGRCFNGMCGRAFEIMACKRMVFQWLNPDTMFKHMKFFADGEDIVYFRDYDELVEKYEYYKDRPEEVRRIALNGYNKVKGYHNQDIRAQYIVDCMTGEYNKWQADQALISNEVNEVYAQL